MKRPRGDVGLMKLKIILLGASGVGKTSLINQYVHKKFHNKPADFREALQTQVKLNDGKSAILQISDTSGQGLEAALFNNVKGCMLVYDVTNPTSLDSLENWHNEFICRVISKPLDSRNLPFIVVGNKVDLDNVTRVSTESAQKWCQSKGLNYHLLTSAKENRNIVEAFQNLAQLSLDHEEKINANIPQEAPKVKAHTPPQAENVPHASSPANDLKSSPPNKNDKHAKPPPQACKWCCCL